MDQLYERLSTEVSGDESYGSVVSTKSHVKNMEEIKIFGSLTHDKLMTFFKTELSKNKLFLKTVVKSVTATDFYGRSFLKATGYKYKMEMHVENGRNGYNVSFLFSPEMKWKFEWHSEIDQAYYRGTTYLSGNTKPRLMTIPGSEKFFIKLAKGINRWISKNIEIV